MPVIVEAENLQKNYNGFTAVNGIDFKIQNGQCFGILGPNGAGKTTVVMMIYCFHPVSGGGLTVFGMNVKDEPRAIKKRLGVVPQENNLDLELSVRENLLIYAGYYGIKKEDAEKRAKELLYFFGLSEKAEHEVDKISGGMKRRLTIARGLIHNPDLLILDEPTTGLDPQSRRLIWEHLRQLKRKGLTLILTTHYLEEATQLCDDLIIMDKGAILEEGKPADLIKKQVGTKVVEIDIDPGNKNTLIKSVQNMISGYQLAGNSLYLFIPEDENTVIKILNNSNYADAYQVRPANLEDVFLKLTGRGLNYEEVSINESSSFAKTS